MGQVDADPRQRPRQEDAVRHGDHDGERERDDGLRPVQRVRRRREGDGRREESRPPDSRADKDFPAYAFVKFVDERSAERALRSENGACWDGSQLVVQFSETLESKKSRRVRRQPAAPNYVSVESPRVVRHAPKESDDAGKYLATFVAAFLPERDDTGFGDVLLRPADRSIGKVDSPLLRDYERLIHQLDDEDESFPDHDGSDAAAHASLSLFSDDAQWGEFHNN